MIIVDSLPTSAVPVGSEMDPLVLVWEQRAKTRQVVLTNGGREIGMKLMTGTRLRPGLVVYIGDGFHVEVVAAAEDVWEVHDADVLTLLRVAYEIGNRHFPIEIGADSLRVLYDHTLQELWERLGVGAERVRRPFLSDQAPSHHHS
jgi:urease accessory protein